MKNKKATAFYITIISIYALTILIYSFSLIFDYAFGQKKIENRFNSLSRSLSIAERKNEINSEKFKDDFLSAAGNFSDIKRLQVTANDQLIISYPNFFEQKELSSNSSKLVQNKSTSFTSSDGNVLTLKAAFYVLKPSTIFYRGIAAFVVIFLASSATAVYLILNYKKQNSKSDEKEFSGEELIFEPEENKTDSEEILENHLLKVEEENSDENKNLNSKTETLEANENFYDEQPKSAQNFEEIESDEGESDKIESNEIASEENKSPAIKEDNFTPLTFTQEEMEVLNQINSDLKKEAEEEEQRELQEQENKPQGLFSPVTKFGWESYMMPRLENELVRSASMEIDIALLLLQIEDIDWTSESGNEISNYILETMKFNDLVFNYKNDACIIILQDANTDKAIEISQEILQNIKKILEANSEENNVALGISTRSLRLISGTRLLNEAEQALSHAKEDKTSPIVAFRVNPEKYKAYIANEGAKLN